VTPGMFLNMQPLRVLTCSTRYQHKAHPLIRHTPVEVPFPTTVLP
jgi:hypothetical protein